MNLISCENCGVVLNQEHLDFPDSIDLPDGSTDLTKAAWSDADKFVPKIACPVCKGNILKEGART